MSQESLNMLKINVHGGFHRLFVRRKFHELLDVAHVCHHRVLAQASFEREVIVIALDG
jgi:hypothetical protein